MILLLQVRTSSFLLVCCLFCFSLHNYSAPIPDDLIWSEKEFDNGLFDDLKQEEDTHSHTSAAARFFR
jgi:hypothetical protein